jgi:hypothetical protein
VARGRAGLAPRLAKGVGILESTNQECLWCANSVPGHLTSGVGIVVLGTRRDVARQNLRESLSFVQDHPVGSDRRLGSEEACHTPERGVYERQGTRGPIG